MVSFINLNYFIVLIKIIACKGFHKICGKKNKDRHAYYHELFLRSREELCPWISRVKSRKIVIDPCDEPNLYAFKSLPLFSKTASTNTSTRPVVRVQTTLYAQTHNYIVHIPYDQQKHQNNTISRKSVNQKTAMPQSNEINRKSQQHQNNINARKSINKKTAMPQPNKINQKPQLHQNNAISRKPANQKTAMPESNNRQPQQHACPSNGVGLRYKSLLETIVAKYKK